MSVIYTGTTWAVVRGLVARQVTDAALRRIFLELRHHGLTTDEVWEYQATTWYPWLREEPAVVATRPPWPDVVWAEPQIVVQLPDEDQPWEQRTHVDQEPPYAEGLVYGHIVGVALTDQWARDGCLRVLDGGVLHPVELSAGDAAIMRHPLPHCTALNLGPAPRVSIYWRTLQRG